MTRPPVLIAVAVLAIFAAPTPSDAQERQTIGQARLFTNDVIGDGRDRWQTGGYWASVFRGEPWEGSLPTRPGAVMEYRVRGDIRSPEDLNSPNPNDRLYAGTWWLGAHTHFATGGFDVAAGLDLAITGEQSGLRQFQGWLHDSLSFPRVDIGAQQVDNQMRLHGTVEVARDLRFGGGAVRPFVELQGGAETMARAGLDVTLGSLGEGGLMTRDPVTGHRVTAIADDDGGWSAIFGADYAYVDSSIFLPDTRGPALEDTRTRLRAGVNYGFGDSNIFYGVTYLSEEFVGQREGQVVGAVTLDFRF
jgi:hypothetical protein